MGLPGTLQWLLCKNISSKNNAHSLGIITLRTCARGKVISHVIVVVVVIIVVVIVDIKIAKSGDLGT